MVDEYLKNKIKENANRLIVFLKEKGVIVRKPELFVSEVVGNALFAGHQMRFLGKKDVDNAIEMANFWRPALASDEEYEKLVCQIIYSMFRLQACAINNNRNCEKLFIGRFCKVDSNSELANGSRENNLKRTYVGVGSKGIVRA